MSDREEQVARAICNALETYTLGAPPTGHQAVLEDNTA